MGIVIVQKGGKGEAFSDRGKKKETITLKGSDFGSGRGRTVLARPNPPPEPPPLDRFKEKVRAFALTALKFGPKEYMEEARPLYREALASFGSPALNTVNLIVLDAYLRRERKGEQKDSLDSLLSKFTVTGPQLEDFDLFRNLYRGAAGEAIVSDYIAKAAAFLAGQIKEPDWEKIPQGRIINDIERPNEYLPLVTVDRDTGLASVQHNNLIIKAAEETLLSSLGTTTFQFLDFLLLKAHRIGNFSGFTVSVSEYMKARGLKDRKGAKAQIKRALSDLYDISMRYDSTKLSRKEKKGLPKGFPLEVDFRILDAKAEINGRGDIAVSFGKAFAPYLAAVPPMEYHRSLLRINSHTYPYAHALGRKLLEAFNMNIEAHRKEIEAGRFEVRLAVETLLKVTGLPTEAEVRDKGRKYLEQIIRPFERDLDALSDMGKWEYCRAKGEPLQPSDDPKKYDTFSALYIRFTFKDYPAQAQRIEKHEEKLTSIRRRKEMAEAKLKADKKEVKA